MSLNFTNFLSVHVHFYNMEYPFSQRYTQDSRLNQGWDEDDNNGPQATLGVRNFAALMCTDNELSTFVVVFQITVDEAWIDVLRANKNDSLKDITKTVINFTSRGRCLDRISKLLESGVSVSVALKKRIESGTTQYLIEISIDPEGRLRWPEGRPIESKRVIKFVAFGIASPKSGWK